MEISANNKSMVFCNSLFWNQSLVWLSDSPRLTDCFTQTVLPVIPLVVLLTLLPYDLYVVRSFNNKLPPIPNQWKYIIILLSIICLSIIKIIDISKTLWNHFSNEINLLIFSHLFCPSIKLITYLLVTILVIHFRKYGYRHSTSLPIHWLCSVFVVSLNLYQILSANNSIVNVFGVVLIVLELFFSIIVLIISCLTPKVATFTSLDSESYHNCPMTEYNVFSRIFLLWIIRILKYGYKTNEDLIQYLVPICSSLKASYSSEMYETADKKYNTNSLAQKKLIPLIWSTSWVLYIVGVVLAIGDIGASFIQPYFLSKLIDFVSGADHYRWHGFYYAIAYCLFNVMARLFDCHAYMLFVFVSFRVRSALITALYKKMFKLSADSRREYTTGDIINLMGVDVSEISTFCQKIYQLFWIPLSITIGICLLWLYLGVASLTLLGVMLTVGPITTLVMKRIDKLQTKQMSLKDKRMEQLSEILNNIKLLKLFGWEIPFIERVTQTRGQELDKQLTINYYWSSIEVLWIIVPMFTAGLTFAVFTLMTDLPLTAKTAFVSLSIFSLLRQPVARFPDLLTHLVRAIVSYKRINKYLSSEEMIINEENEELSDDSVVNLKGCSFGWSIKDDPILTDIDLNIKKGSLVAIVGRVGAGKSSLFSALMGEMYRTAGNQRPLSGSVAYVAQTAWIQNCSLRQNITFISEYENSKYERVVNACALKPDFDLLPANDMTEIGEKGINLSGGQKHRVSLARAVYNDSDIYLLDDPLSAVDAHVAQHLFEEVIGPKGLLGRKTRLLATHNISFLKHTDHILVMSNGNIIGAGSYDELSEKGLLSEQVLSKRDDTSIASGDTGVLQRQSSQLSAHQSIGRISRQISRKREDSTSDKPETLKEKLEKEAERAQLIDEEHQQYGNIGFRVYLNYLIRCGIVFTLIPFMTGIAFNVFEIGGNYYLNIWSSQNSTQIIDPSNKKTFLSIYLSAVLLNAIFVTITQVVFRIGTVRAAAKLHKDMLFSIMRTPMSFFNVTPLGRIINRFSHDISSIDEELPFYAIEAVTCFIWFSIILGVIAYNNPFMVIQILIVISIFLVLYRFYLWTSRQLHRLDSITRSPVYSHFNESISGAASIRAYKVQNVFIERLLNLMDININVNKHIYSTINWIDIWTSIIGSIITLSTALVVVLNKNEMSAGLAGFILVYSVEVINSFSWGLRSAAELENSMVSVERVKEYSELDPEFDWESAPELKPPHNWPQNPRIEFINFTASYRPELEPILKNMNFRVDSCEKVGIVGRTGAGKSSITLALFRIIEPRFGRIVIDGIDITRIGLHDLRSKLTIIPQEPNLFAGTLRLNLDPFSEYTDERLWSALENSHLKDFFSNSSDGLSYEITEGGDNLSAGQRQLVCLGRALLRDTKILVLDEATAACDLETDLLIQRTIKEKFNDCTVITIAHRLNTVLDYNKIIVLENGIIVEMDSPKNLLKTSDSLFYGLAKEFGIV